MSSRSDIERARVLAEAIETAIRNGEIRRFRHDVDEWEQTISRVRNHRNEDDASMEVLRDALAQTQKWLDFARQWTDSLREKAIRQRWRHKAIRQVVAAYVGAPSQSSRFVRRRG
jgi:septal ring factor EnvC (AmiA/AmiB activator)